MEVKYCLKLSSRGSGLDDVCGGMASLRLLEFVFVAIRSRLCMMCNWVILCNASVLPKHVVRFSISFAVFLKIATQSEYGLSQWVVDTHTSRKHSCTTRRPYVHVFGRHALRCAVCYRQTAALLRQFL